MAIYQNASLIYNPFAGKLNGKNDHLLQRTIAVLTKCGHRVTPVATTGPQTAASIASGCIKAGADVILAAGGDGTINEVMNGMIHSDVPLGILPAGTANVLACEMKIGTRMTVVAEKLHTLLPRKIAVGRLTQAGEHDGRHFILMAGAGLDAMIVYQIDAGLKAALGKVAYWVAGFRQVGRRLAEMDVRVDGRDLRCSFALASRVRNYGGDLNIARNASLLNDHFELVLFEGPSSLAYLKYFTGALTNRLAGMKGVKLLRAQRVELLGASNPRVYLQIDGERAGVLPATLSIIPNAINLLMPPAYG
ncbi:MAG: diacylglycerol kinase family protein [Bryobacteraceae bacterium]